MEEKRMRGVHSAVDEIRRNVFTEVARLAYEGGDLKRVDMIPYTIVPGEVARHRHDVFPAMPAPPSRSGLRTAARAACPIPA